MEQHEIISGLREERERLVGFLRSVPEASWELYTLCEGWAVRDVVSHLVGNCANVLEQELEGLGSAEYNQRQVIERKDRTPQELLAEWAEKGPAVEAVYAAMPPDLWAFEMGGVIGTIGGGVLRHLEDLWIHAQDIQIPLGHDPSAGPGLTAALNLIVEELPPLLVKHAPGVAALELQFPDFHATVTGSGSDTVRISGDPVAFAMVATGRRTLDGAEADGRLTVDGELPNRERVLQIYGPEFAERV